MRNKGILSATFEQSKKVVSKKILTEDGAQIGVLSSMKFSQRLSGLIILLLFVVGYGLGFYLPESLLISTEEAGTLSGSAIQTILCHGGTRGLELQLKRNGNNIRAYTTFSKQKSLILIVGLKQ